MTCQLRRSAAAVLLAATALVVSACSGTPEVSESLHAGQVNPDASLAVGLVLEPNNLDIRKTAGAAIEQVLQDNVYQGLVARTPGGEIQPALAVEWEVSDDGRTYTFTTHEGVTFHDGAAFTADDVVSSLTEVIEDESFAGHGELAGITSVEAADAQTVVITLEQPDQNLLFALAGPAGVIVDEDDTTDLATDANGTGPFALDVWNEGDSIVLTRNDAYFGEPAGVAEVVFTYIPDFAAGINAALGGQLDVLTGIDPQLVSQLEGAPDWNVSRGKTTDKWVLAFNNTDPALEDVRVREALRLAIDHDAVITAYGAGVPLHGPIPELDPGYEDLSDVISYDPDRARKLLAEAGAEGLELELTVPSFYGTTLSTLLVSAFNDIGVTLTVNPVEFATWINDVFTNGDYQLSLVNHVEPRDFAAWTNPEYYVHYDNTEVQELYKQAAIETDAEASADLLRQAARIVSEDHAADWLLNGEAIIATTPRVSGFPQDSTSSRLNLAAVTLAN